MKEIYYKLKINLNPGAGGLIGREIISHIKEANQQKSSLIKELVNEKAELRK